ncbi:MAG: EutN/CcmL family microcompartment protein [Planctomycetia bacterium]|nr:EutN/CcmL family microcompartment protein [Planctomycetia bacterium]
MRIGQVVGKVTLNRVHPSLVGAQFKILIPLTFKDLVEPTPIEEAQASAEQERALNEGERIGEAVERLKSAPIPQDWAGQIVVYDDCSAAIGEWLAFSEGAEAAAVFVDDKKPVDAFGGAIIDELEIDYETTRQLAQK